MRHSALPSKPVPCSEIDAPSTIGLEDHPIGPYYIPAKEELDLFNEEMAKLGTMETPNFNTNRKSRFDVAFGSRSK